MFVLGLLLVKFVYTNASPTIKLGETTLVGRDIPSLGQEFFGGIPFAEPPLGNLRLRPPVPKTSIGYSTLNATDYGPACLQTANGIAPDQVSEDCLTINVLRPSGTPANAKLPVMFWTFGGGFVGGLSSQFNASAIVAQSVTRGTPVIYVNFNYRLGPLGFALGQEAGEKGALNLGIKDQLAALEWVKANIETFGGDKSKVTVFGESAGAIMTSILFLNLSLNNLARAAILESGSQATSALFTSERGELDWQNFVAAVPSCAFTVTSGSTFDCLRRANTTEIFTGLSVVTTPPSAGLTAPDEPLPWGPVLDGPGGVIPDLPSVLFSRGSFARLPFIAGTNKDEGTVFTPPAINSTEEIIDGLVALFNPTASPTTELEQSIQTLLQLYPDIPALGSPFDTSNNTFGLNSQYKRAAAGVGDLNFQSQRRLWMETAANAGVKTFGYLFTQPQPLLPAAFGVPHSSEIRYVYGAPTDTSASSVLISRLMIEYWVSFTTSLTPNDGQGIPRPEWAQFTPQNKTLIQLNGANVTMIPDDFRAEQMDFINSNPTIWRH
ncbi:extracellular triacylglycerol lipase precursor [Mycena alexandri]|uniref:Carboxylic ester hydrolase n=1 Tax=Mycena alexandri TaxID=1745969 RepID=A0AAD6WTY0_9AGAR|nr:extracellular triacylglycerol lipase precursor [Mycena alexandri]